MPQRALLVASLLMTATLVPLPASAATGTPMSTAPVTEDGATLLQNVGWGRPYYRDDYYRGGYYRDRYSYRGGYYGDGYWRRCRAWRHECASRWGWGGWEYRRCLRRHDC
jgi:hypothetical protein